MCILLQHLSKERAMVSRHVRVVLSVLAAFLLFSSLSASQQRFDFFISDSGSSPSIVSDGAGGFYVGWHRMHGGNHLQQFDSLGGILSDSLIYQNTRIT